MRILLPLLILFSLMLTGPALAVQRHLEITWTAAQYSDVTIAGYRLYDATGNNVCEINDPNATSMLCDVEVADNSTTFTMTTFSTTGEESPHSQPFTVYFNDALVPSIQYAQTQNSFTYSFDATGSTSSGTITNYTWNFGDGSASSYESVTEHTFVAAGEYTVSLTIQDDTGAIQTTSVQIAVTDLSNPNNPPVAAISASTTVGASPLTISFDGSGSSDPDNDPLTYVWNFGDGSTATGAQVSHVYLAAGNYTAELTVQDSAGATARATLPVIVSAPTDTGTTTPEPTAIISLDSATGTAPLYVTADATSSTPSTTTGTIVQYSWNFGDGSTGTGPISSHTYSAVGTYTITLTITDDSGKQDTATARVQIMTEQQYKASRILPAIYKLLLFNKK